MGSDSLANADIKKALSQNGLRILSANNGYQGLPILVNHSIDLVFYDPLTDPLDPGIFVTAARSITPWIHIVFWTDKITETFCKQATELGVQTTAERPATPEALTALLHEQAQLLSTRQKDSMTAPLNCIRNHIHLLRDQTAAIIKAKSVQQALLSLCGCLGDEIPALLIAIMYRSITDDRVLYTANMKACLPKTVLESIGDLMQRKYKMLCGESIRLPAEWALSGTKTDENQSAPAHQHVCIPIIGEKRINGILLFALTTPDIFTKADISLLHHAANHFSCILEASHSLRELAVHDELTGLYNRHHIQAELPAVWEMASRYGLTPGFVIIDVDHFKLINDNYGHTAGDDAMQNLGKIVRQMFRGSDIIARYGGDEIIIVLPDADPGSLNKLTERMRKAVAEHLFYPQGSAFQCTISIGAASGRDAEGNLIPAEELMTHADEALYTAKRNGRNRAVIWTKRDTGNNKEATTRSSEDEQLVRTKAPTVMVVDDDPSVLKIVRILLESEKMSVETFETAKDALEAFQANPTGYDIALVDLNLEAMTGLDLTKIMCEKNPFLVSIIITGDATLENAVSSLRHGAYDFIQKPIQRNQLGITLDRALEYHRLRLENEEYQQNLEAMVRRKSLELATALKRTRDSFDFTLRSMTAMLDAREHDTAEHSVRVQQLTIMIAQKFGLSEKDLSSIRQGALLHDIGKIGIPDHILLKKGALSEDERAAMRSHVRIGHALIEGNPDLKAAADIILCHHERFDGSGYPRGIKGSEIPLGARIFAVIDSYDAMRSTRPYRIGMSRKEALEELKKHSGTQYDPIVVQMFLKHVDEVEAIGQWK
jgi:diguanylate cyclase (GGDEF)-like protein/putative nucleotidyltransferase with HDIG domain